MFAEYRNEPVTRKRKNNFVEAAMKNQQKIMIRFQYISLNKEDVAQKGLDDDRLK